jgi:hypothetical protein
MVQKRFFLIALVVLMFSAVESIAQTTYFPATGLYNGYLDQINILECENSGTLKVNPILKVYSQEGSILSTISMDISAKGSQHIILNDLTRIKDTYGTYKIELPTGQMLHGDRISCRTVFYRGAPQGSEKAYDFAYSLPVRNPDSGVTAGVYNSYNPVALADPTYNWLSIVNLDSIALNADIELYDLPGQKIKTIPVNNLAANSRIDIALGHDVGQITGTYRIVPKNRSLKYQSFLMRYGISGNKMDFAFPLRSTAGSCSGSLVQLSTMGSPYTTNWLEVVNLNASRIPVKIVIRDRNGVELQTKNETLQPFSQYHLYANAIIDPQGTGNVGSAQVICQDPTDRILTESLYYGKSSPAKVEWAYASQDIGSTGVPEGSQLFAPINTFLDMKNWLKLANTSKKAQTSYKLFNQSGTEVSSGDQEVNTFGTADLGLHAQVAKDMVGSVTTSSKTGGSVFSGELLRIIPKRNGDIGNIIQIPGIIQRTGIVSQKTDEGSKPIGFIGDPQSLSQYRDNLTYEEVSHLYARAALGAKHSEILRLQEIGLGTIVKELMTFQDTPGLEASSRKYLNTGYPDQPALITISGTQKYWINHLLNTPNPLKERLALIWHDLFAASCRNVGGLRNSNACYSHLQVLRSNASGNFKTLAESLTTDYLMLVWLNGNHNTVGRADENYGREFWELFTLGEPSKHLGRHKLYDSKDVAESSRAFTGWITPFPEVQDPALKAEFVPRRFDAGLKTIFAGTPYGVSGNFNHSDIIKHTLDRHEAAEWVVKRLFTAFVHDHPSAQVVNELADLLIANNYNVSPVVKKILLSEAMFSTEAKQKRVKDAITYIIGFIRSSGIPTSVDTVYNGLSSGKLGYEPLFPPSVNGWPINKYEGASLSSYFLGWNASYLNLIRSILSSAETTKPGFSYSTLLPFAGATTDQVVEHWSLVMGIKLSADEKVKLVDYMNTQKSSDGKNVARPFVPTNAVHLRQKIPGLLWLLSQHEDYLSF